MHAPATHVMGPQAVRHAPQFAGSLAVLVSQPLEALPSQLAVPGAQVSPHAPAVHVRVALAPPGHALPHPPQLSTLDCVSTQVAPQRAWPTAHPDPHDDPEEPVTQTGVAPAQRFEQSPHASADVRSTSQPFTGLASQSAVPAAQVMPHTPPAHTAVDDAPDGHARPHAPQLAVLVRMFTSHPLPGFPSQSAKPALQPERQRPPTHATTALGPALHAAAHAPQFVTLDSVLVSQPFVALPSQSP